MDTIASSNRLLDLNGINSEGKVSLCYNHSIAQNLHLVCSLVNNHHQLATPVVQKEAITGLASMQNELGKD